MKSQQLDAKQIFAWGNALGQVEVAPAPVVNHSINSPLSGAGIQVVLGDLKPVEPRNTGIGSAGNLSKPSSDGTFVGFGDWVVQVSWILGSTNNMLPPGADFVPRRDRNDFLGRCCYFSAYNVL